MMVEWEVLVSIIVRKFRDTNHGREDLRDNVEGTPEKKKNENGRNGILEKVDYRAEDGVKSTCADGESVEAISPDVVPKLFHQWALRAQCQGLLLTHNHRQNPHTHRSHYHNTGMRNPILMFQQSHPPSMLFTSSVFSQTDCKFGRRSMLQVFAIRRYYH